MTNICNLRYFDQLGLCPASAFNAKPSGGVHDLTHSNSQALNYHYRYPKQEFACEIQFPENDCKVIDDSFQYFIAGQQFDHFGHFMSESLSRMESFLTLSAEKTKIVWYTTRPTVKRSTSNELRNYIMKYFGIDSTYVESIDYETIVNNAILADQSWQLGNPKNGTGWTKILMERQEIRSSRIEIDKRQNLKVIISRKDFVRKVCGEDYIFQKISERGFTLVQPENLSLDEQFTLLTNSQCIVLSEGSFLHWLEILGECNATIFLFPRRPLRTRSTQHQVQLVKQKAPFSKIFNEPDFQISLFKNDVANSVGVYRFSNMEKSLQVISDYLGVRVLIDRSEYLYSVEKDLIAYFNHYGANRNFLGKLVPKEEFFERVREILANI